MTKEQEAIIYLAEQIDNHFNTHYYGCTDDVKKILCSHISGIEQPEMLMYECTDCGKKFTAMEWRDRNRR